MITSRPLTNPTCSSDSTSVSICAAAQNAIDAFILKLSRRQIGSYQCEVAMETVQVLRTYVHSYKDTNMKGLLDGIKTIGSCVMKAHPTQFAVGNIVRRVLRIIKEEVSDFVSQELDLKSPPSPFNPPSFSGSISIMGENSAGKSIGTKSQYLDSGMYNLIALDKDRTKPFHLHELAESAFYRCKTAIIQAINEFIDELESMDFSISSQSLEHIHSNEIIMTYGLSNGVEEFLLNAARKRKFQVVVAESSPGYDGQSLAVSLSKAGIETTLIPDSAIYALMSRVNKVILGCSAVLANGGIISQCGTLMLASAAKEHSTPIVVLAGLYKISPVFPYDLNGLNLLTNPQNVIPYDSKYNCENVQIMSPAFDYIPADYLSTFVTNLGANSPSYIYRLLDECYNEEDFNLQIN